MNLLKISCLIFVFTTCGCAQTTTIRQHQDFANVFPKYKSVSVISADMLIAKQTKNGQEISIADPEKVGNITQMAGSALSKKGYNLKEIKYGDEDLKYASQFNKAYKKSVTDLYANPDMANKEKALSTNASLGSNVSKITKSDLLLVLSYTGSEMAQDEVTKSFATDMALTIGMAILTRGQNQSQSNTHIKDGSAAISLIDGHNGNILWTNIGTDFEDYGISVARMITKKNVMDEAFSKVLATLPDKTKVNN